MSSQSEIFSRYRSLVVSNTQKPYVSDAQKKINKLEFIDFLVELVKSTRGQKEFKSLILKGSLSQLKKFDSINKVITDAFFQMFGCDPNLVIPEKYTTLSVTGIEISKQEIDSFGLLNIAPDSRIGKLQYDGNDITKHVNYFFSKAQNTTTDTPLILKKGDRVLFTLSAIDNSTFLFKFGEFYSKKQFGEFLKDYLEIVTPVFNFPNFMAILMDILTGSLSVKGNLNKTIIVKQSFLIKGLKKMFGFCGEEDDTTKPDSTNKKFLNDQYGPNQAQKNGEGTGLLNTDSDYDNVFNFNNKELDDIENVGNLRANSFLRFSSCGNLDVAIDPDDIINSLEDLFNNSQGTKLLFPGENPNQVVDQPNNQIIDNATKIPNLDQAANLLEKGLNNGLNKVINDGETNAVLNLPNINAEVQLNILKAIPYALMQMIITPKLMVVPKLYLVLKGDTSKKTPENMISFIKPLIVKIGNYITDLLVKNIFNLIKKDLVNLAKKISADFLKQRGLDYISSLKSLLALLKALKGFKIKGCESIIEQILRLLKLLNFTPMPPIPPPLVLLGGALKPGLNHIAMINDLKSNLSEKGIETAATFPDGTPNHLMIALEETVKLMVSNIKTNAKVEVTTTGAGFTTGFGQIQ
jgi:hypothetical protein